MESKQCPDLGEPSTSITVNKQHVLLMSAYFTHSGCADHHVEKIHRSNGKLTKSKKKSFQMVGGYFNAELRPGLGVERVSVGPHKFREGNKRGDWMKYWLMIQHFIHPTRCTEKRLKASFLQDPERCIKQLDYMLVDREHMCCSRDAEANDTIHMGRDQRSVRAQFLITAPEKEVSQNSPIDKKKIQTAESKRAKTTKKRDPTKQTNSRKKNQA